jgi:hypothetical protein
VCIGLESWSQERYEGSSVPFIRREKLSCVPKKRAGVAKRFEKFRIDYK